MTPAQKILQLQEENIDHKIDLEKSEQRIRDMKDWCKSLEFKIAFNLKQIEQLKHKVNGTATLDYK